MIFILIEFSNYYFEKMIIKLTLSVQGNVEGKINNSRTGIRKKNSNILSYIAIKIAVSIINIL